MLRLGTYNALIGETALYSAKDTGVHVLCQPDFISLRAPCSSQLTCCRF